jgi:dihydroorotate dehydrogenase
VLYRLLFRALLRRVPPERAHALAARGVGAAGRVRAVREPLRRRLATRDPALAVEALGLRFPSPLGVAAGVDKDASWFEGLGALGFGFVEVGTLTARPQPGNPRPRVFRLLEDRALLNSMGFPNPGAATAAARLRARTRETVVGVNVGRSRTAGSEDTGADVRAAVRQLAPWADFLVVNVSSPNTPGLRELQAVGPLGALLADVRDELRAVGRAQLPLLVKIAPDLGDDELDAIADLALELELAGIVAVNTTVARAGLRADPALTARPGGISGAPLKTRALQVLARLRTRAGDRLALVSAGGIETADDAWERILAGATLVQAYTGFVYGGPLWPSRVNRELACRARAAGAASIGELVGTVNPAATDRR